MIQILISLSFNYEQFIYLPKLPLILIPLCFVTTCNVYICLIKAFLRFSLYVRKFFACARLTREKVFESS